MWKHGQLVPTCFFDVPIGFEITHFICRIHNTSCYTVYMIQNLGPDKIAFKWTKYKKTEQKGYATFQSNQFSLADSV